MCHCDLLLATFLGVVLFTEFTEFSSVIGLLVFSLGEEVYCFWYILFS